MTKAIQLSEKIFIAGAYGMVGSSIKKILKKRGYDKSLLTPHRSDLNF